MSSSLILTKPIKKKLLARHAIVSGSLLLRDFPALFQKHGKSISRKGIEMTHHIMTQNKLFAKKVTDDAQRAIVPIVHGISQLLSKHPNKELIRQTGTGILQAQPTQKRKWPMRALKVGAATVLAGLMLANKDKIGQNISKFTEYVTPMLGKLWDTSKKPVKDTLVSMAVSSAIHSALQDSRPERGYVDPPSGVDAAGSNNKSTSAVQMTQDRAETEKARRYMMLDKRSKRERDAYEKAKLRRK